MSDRLREVLEGIVRAGLRAMYATAVAPHDESLLIDALIAHFSSHPDDLAEFVNACQPDCAQCHGAGVMPEGFACSRCGGSGVAPEVLCPACGKPAPCLVPDTNRGAEDE